MTLDLAYLNVSMGFNSKFTPLMFVYFRIPGAIVT